MRLSGAHMPPAVPPKGRLLDLEEPVESTPPPLPVRETEDRRPLVPKSRLRDVVPDVDGEGMPPEGERPPTPQNHLSP
jgi:hypothetical protein